MGVAVPKIPFSKILISTKGEKILNRKLKTFLKKYKKVLKGA